MMLKTYDEIVAKPHHNDVSRGIDIPGGVSSPTNAVGDCFTDHFAAIVKMLDASVGRQVRRWNRRLE